MRDKMQKTRMKTPSAGLPALYEPGSPSVNGSNAYGCRLFGTPYQTYKGPQDLFSAHEYRKLKGVKGHMPFFFVAIRVPSKRLRGEGGPVSVPP